MYRIVCHRYKSKTHYIQDVADALDVSDNFVAPLQRVFGVGVEDKCQLIPSVGEIRLVVCSRGCIETKDNAGCSSHLFIGSWSVCRHILQRRSGGACSGARLYFGFELLLEGVPSENYILSSSVQVASVQVASVGTRHFDVIYFPPQGSQHDTHLFCSFFEWEGETSRRERCREWNDGRSVLHAGFRRGICCAKKFGVNKFQQISDTSLFIELVRL